MDGLLTLVLGRLKQVPKPIPVRLLLNNAEHIEDVVVLIHLFHRVDNPEEGLARILVHHPEVVVALAGPTKCQLQGAVEPAKGGVGRTRECSLNRWISDLAEETQRDLDDIVGSLARPLACRFLAVLGAVEDCLASVAGFEDGRVGQRRDVVWAALVEAPVGRWRLELCEFRMHPASDVVDTIVHDVS